MIKEFLPPIERRTQSMSLLYDYLDDDSLTESVRQRRLNAVSKAAMQAAMYTGVKAVEASLRNDYEQYGVIDMHMLQSLDTRMGGIAYTIFKEIYYSISTEEDLDLMGPHVVPSDTTYMYEPSVQLAYSR